MFCGIGRFSYICIRESCSDVGVVLRDSTTRAEGNGSSESGILSKGPMITIRNARYLQSYVAGGRGVALAIRASWYEYFT